MELRKQLAQVEDDLRSLREEKAVKAAAREEAKVAYEALPEDADHAEVMDNAKEAVRAHGEIVDQIEAKTLEQVDLLKLLDRKEEAQRVEETSTVAPRVQLTEGLSAGWRSRELLANEDLQQQLQFISGTKSRVGSVEIGEVLDRDGVSAMIGAGGMYAASEDAGVTTRMREGSHRGVLPQLVRPLSFLSLLPTGTADGNLIPYTQEVGQLTGGGPVAEGAAKEQVDIDFVDADAPIRTIAAYMKLRKQVLSDYPALRSIMDTRLRYIVNRRLEEQVLDGDGTGQNLDGLLHISGTGSVAYNANVPLNELFLSGITNVFLNGGSADGIVVAPQDWMKVLTEKAHFGGGAGATGTAGSYEYYGGGPYAGTPSSQWGVPVVPSQALSAGEGIVADFALAVTLLIREGLNVLLSDSDQDDFIKNRITMLAELRAGLPVWRPSVIQVVDTAA